MDPFELRDCGDRVHWVASDDDAWSSSLSNIGPDHVGVLYPTRAGETVLDIADLCGDNRYSELHDAVVAIGVSRQQLGLEAE